jgi:hypothetical protein
MDTAAVAWQALVYDSRTLHRGLANTSNEARPVLILRYDREATPPPGVRLSGTVLIRVLVSVYRKCAPLILECKFSDFHFGPELVPP